MTNLLRRFVKDRSGATTIEYGLIGALISVVIIGAIKMVGTNLSNTFNNIAQNALEFYIWSRESCRDLRRLSRIRPILGAHPPM